VSAATRAASAPPSPSQQQPQQQPIHTSGAHRCQNCEDSDAAVYCAECCLYLCDANGCASGLHRPAKAQHHKPIAIGLLRAGAPLPPPVAVAASTAGVAASESPASPRSRAASLAAPQAPQSPLPQTPQTPPPPSPLPRGRPSLTVDTRATSNEERIALPASPPAATVTAAPSAPSARPVTPSSAAGAKCQSCMAAAASVACVECGRAFCARCDAATHKVRQMATHLRRPLLASQPQSPATESEASPRHARSPSIGLTAPDATEPTMLTPPQPLQQHAQPQPLVPPLNLGAQVQQLGAPRGDGASTPGSPALELVLTRLGELAASAAGVATSIADSNRAVVEKLEALAAPPRRLVPQPPRAPRPPTRHARPVRPRTAAPQVQPPPPPQRKSSRPRVPPPPPPLPSRKQLLIRLPEPSKRRRAPAFSAKLRGVQQQLEEARAANEALARRIAMLETNTPRGWREATSSKRQIGKKRKEEEEEEEEEEGEAEASREPASSSESEAKRAEAEEKEKDSRSDAASTAASSVSRASSTATLPRARPRHRARSAKRRSAKSRDRTKRSRSRTRSRSQSIARELRQLVALRAQLRELGGRRDSATAEDTELDDTQRARTPRVMPLQPLAPLQRPRVRGFELPVDGALPSGLEDERQRWARRDMVIVVSARREALLARLASPPPPQAAATAASLPLHSEADTTSSLPPPPPRRASAQSGDSRIRQYAETLQLEALEALEEVAPVAAWAPDSSPPRSPRAFPRLPSLHELGRSPRVLASASPSPRQRIAAGKSSPRSPHAGLSRPPSAPDARRRDERLRRKGPLFLAHAGPTLFGHSLGRF
jgi:hypothetical protein